jgi:sigma-B regulation protein RsbU (phosphoserine phosphatase)
VALFVVMAVVVVPPLLHVRSELSHQRDVLAPANSAVNQLATSTLDQETGVRGYLLTGAVAFLSPYTEGRAMSEQSLRVLEGSTISELHPVAADLRRDLTRWQLDIAEPQIAARRRGNLRLAQSMFVAAAGKTQFDQIRADISRLSGVVSSHVNSTRSELRDATDTLIIAMLVSLVLALVLTGIAFQQLRRWLTQPIGVLLSSLRAVGAGDFEHTVPAVGASEIAEIGASADDMRQRMVDELADARRSREALEQRGPVVLLLRGELDPSEAQLPPGLDLAARFEPAVGLLAGDFYDLLPLPDGGLGLVVVDVSGHGPSAGIMAVRIKYLIEAALGLGMSPAQCLAWLADHVGPTQDRFATCLVARVAPDEGRITYASAGHPPLLLAANGEVEAHGPTGPLLGPFAGSWDEAEVAMPAGAVAVVCTDGIFEARAGSGDLFGVEPVRRILADASRADAPAEQVATDVHEAVRAFAEGPARDDLTLVVVRATGVRGMPTRPAARA